MSTEGTRVSDFFVVSGTLRPDAPSYVERPADKALLNLALAGEFCYVLTSRQMGKSSLMVRTARRLQEQGIRTATIDLTKIGTDVSNISVEQWYLGLITRLKSELKLSVDPEDWWAERSFMSVVQRFIDFLHDVVLTEIEGLVVIFMDEIDTTLNLGFSDDFFAAVRSIYNERATEPVYNRLTFVLLGVAAPADLIKDPSRTPFNIGRRIDLHEFSREDAQVLEQGLENTHPAQGKAIFDRIFYWTNGHPYLTQKLCLAASETGDGRWTDRQVDKLVEQQLLSEEVRNETNLKFVRDCINASPQRRRLLGLYRKVYEGEEIPEDERSLDQNRLKLFGLVRAEGGVLKVRNEIYRRVFSLEWIKANTPIDWTRRIAVISTALVLLLTGAISFSYYRQKQQTTEARAQAFIDNFRSTTSAEVRITSLAGLLELPNYEDQARQLFYQGLSPEEQLALFDLTDPQAVGMQLITVVKGLYTDQTDDEYGSALLRGMVQPLRKIDDPMAINLATEIEQWLKGRDSYTHGEYQQALTAYSVAISLNNHNPGIYFDRGLAYAALGEYADALADLQTVVELNSRREEAARQAIYEDPDLFTYLGLHRQEYQNIAVWFPTLTPMLPYEPTAVPTPRPMSSFPVLAATAVPQPVSAISPSSTDQVTQLARWGKGTVQEVIYSPDGALLVVASSIGIYLYDARTLTETRFIETGTWVTSLTFSPDGAILAAGSLDSTVQLWRVEDWKLLYTLKGHTDEVRSVAFSPDGRLLASGAYDGTIRLWRVDDGVLLRTLEGHTDWVRDVDFSPDGTILASASEDTTVRLWRVADGKPLRTLRGHTDYVRSTAFSPDGTTLASGSGDTTVRLWRVSDGLPLLTLLGHKWAVRSVAFSPDGALLTSGSADSTVRLWRVKDGTPLYIMEGHTYWVDSVAFSPDGRTLASGSGDTTVRLWQVSDGTPLSKVGGYLSSVTSVAFSPDGALLASGAWGGAVRLWQVSDGTVLDKQVGHISDVYSVAFSPDGSTLASASNDNTVGLWETNDWALLRVLQGHTDDVWYVAFSPDGLLLASGSLDGTVRLWRVPSGVLLRTLRDHKDWVRSVAFSPDGTLIASGSHDSTVRLWWVSNGILRHILEGHGDEVRSVSFSPDGALLASGSDDGTVRLWQTSDGRLSYLLEGHEGGVRSIVFSPDGSLLASGSAEGAVQLWQVSDGTLLRTLRGHTEEVRYVAFSPDGRLLASASGDCTVRLWGVLP